ncbi:Fpg/Nei family DNA glycosylase [Leucobacter chromiireducens]|uniref:DNA-(apurinic or apyrimidinic site) lyase n=1 Tax=Leucobacter chromiireducens subsp. chromiireducens TaxID=660067 RepID=A0ABS1SRR4_9MICO|nr:DNA-formamidopyrimidine glycosylase family protein [Leucobacter chromiireducens]MBL3690841.1 Fpg/Nei family DNA glycosylase [Leucobacter chromiireducens subsp. chromiireducens]
MPEGHSVHRIARQFGVNFVGEHPAVSSPQGRFAQGAALLDGRNVLDARAVGKQMFLEFEGDQWLRVHLGIYGAWDFSGEVRIDSSIQIHGQTPGHSRLGQNGENSGPGNHVDRDAEDSVTSIGAPRRTRVRMAETDKESAASESFPPEPVGQVRVRLLTDTVCADLRGPTACEVLTPAEVDAVVQRLGPDPANANTPAERARFVERAGKKKTPIGLVLMDQSVVAGIGNVYRAEMLFRAELNPHTPANTLDRTVLEALWDDWAELLEIGITVGQMITIDGLEGEAYQRALVERDERHWVYKLEGTPCKRCGANIILEEFGARKLYWCPGCQH